MESITVADTVRRLPPGPTGVAGAFWVLGKLRRQVYGMTELCQRYGSVVRLQFPGMLMYLVNEPSLIEQILVTDNKNYVKDAFMRSIGAEVLGQGLLSSDGDLWRRQRRLVQPAFHHQRIAEYAKQMVACGEEYVEALQEGQERNLHRDMMQLTLRVVLRTLLSVESDDLTEEISDAFAVITTRYDMGLWTILRTRWNPPLPTAPRFAKAVKRVNEIVQEVIRHKRLAGPSPEKSDILDMLLAARDEDGTGVSDEQLRDEVITMFSAGHETTALALTYAFLLLSQHREATRKLTDELASVLGGRPPTFEDLPRLRYTEAVVLETMRLYPPAWGFGRDAVCDTELGGYYVAKGTNLSISPWVVHRDSRTFPEPEEFKPERWLDGLQKRLPRFAYLPFGGGPRQCIGNSFATIEAVLLLATIAGRYRLSVTAEDPLRFVMSLTLRPRRPLRTRVERV